ncbi:MAG TPA: hypothetical protein VNW46_07750 [Gemmatimonadaceae bacterium]|nr:hypothetical protein [Gemmatimonadaceae bacterium]
MRLRADVVRAWGERLLRVAVIILLGWYLVETIRARGHGAEEQGTSARLRERLARWSTVAAPQAVHVALDHPPAGVERDWLAALPAAATVVSWSGPALLPTAVAVEPRADPAGGADLSVAAPADSLVVLRDTVGTLDSARATVFGVRAEVPRPRPIIDAVVGAVTARGARHDSLTLKRLLVIGQAGWEMKFTVAGLEERGWGVDAHYVVSPKSDVRQGDHGSIDTARYAAVLAIDTTAAHIGDRIAKFVHSGGGLVLWSPAAKARSLAALAPGGAGTLVEDDGVAPPDSAPRAVLELVPIVGLVPDAIVLERRGAQVSLAARRVGAGRVIETGYTDLWRWRTAGGDASPEQHRAWLAGLVARVAYAPRVSVAAPPTDVAPVATLIDRLGVATRESTVRRTIDPALIASWIFGILCAALVIEWASRRVRGVK